MTWIDAQRHCREHFDDLATVDNPEELKQLQESRSGSDYDNESMWIGLYDDITIWHWSHGNQDYIVGQHYGNWKSEEPNNFEGKEYCTEITTEGWNDLPCTTLASSVCIDGGIYICKIQQVAVALGFGPIPFPLNKINFKTYLS